MIVRRVPLTNPPAWRPSFLDDDRLDADEIGTMLYFNCLKHGAEIDLITIGRRLHCGTARFGRILKNLRAFGYVETRTNYKRGRGSGRGRATAEFIVRDRAAGATQ